MRKRAREAAILLYVVAGLTPPAVAQVDEQRAAQYFTEVQTLCAREGGRLWGVSLCGPMVIGDMRTQTFATSERAPEAPRPRLVGLVNAPVEWGGATWGAYIWDCFVRTFAYTSGTAYGLLLDASSDGWTRRVRATDDLAVLAMNALARQPASDPTASAARYGGADLRAAEQQRQQQRQERVAELRRRFVDGPVLLIQGGGRGSFDARGAVVIPGSGTVYFGAYRFSGDWGTLEAENGVLVGDEGGSRRIPAPVRTDDVTVSGDGWAFKAAPGWAVREGAKRGDYEVARER